MLVCRAGKNELVSPDRLNPECGHVSPGFGRRIHLGAILKVTVEASGLMACAVFRMEARKMPATSVAISFKASICWGGISCVSIYDYTAPGGLLVPRIGPSALRNSEAHGLTKALSVPNQSSMS